MRITALMVSLLVVLMGCSNRPRIQTISSLSPTRSPRPTVSIEPTPSPEPIFPVDESANTIKTRYNTRAGYTRDGVDPGSFEEFLQNMSLKATGATVTLHDGTTREDKDYEAVIDRAVIDQNEQAAGAMARLFAEYHFAAQEMERIALTLNDGFKPQFSEWAKGKTIRLNSSEKLAYGSGGAEGENQDNFNDFLAACYKWNSMRSLLAGDLSAVPTEEPIRIGDVFAADGDAKYAVIVVDSAKDEAGNQHVMLASGDKPAQELRLWANPLDTVTSPWFAVDTLNDRIDTGREGVALTMESRYRFNDI